MEYNSANEYSPNIILAEFKTHIKERTSYYGCGDLRKI